MRQVYVDRVNSHLFRRLLQQTQMPTPLRLLLPDQLPTPLRLLLPDQLPTPLRLPDQLPILTLLKNVGMMFRNLGLTLLHPQRVE